MHKGEGQTVEQVLRLFGGQQKEGQTAIQSYWPSRPAAAGQQAAEAKPYAFAQLPLDAPPEEPPEPESLDTGLTPFVAEPEPPPAPSQAEALLEQAGQEAQVLLDAAAAEAEAIRQAALEAGKQEGYEAGYREGIEAAGAECRQELAESLQDAMGRVADALGEIEAARAGLLAEHLEAMRDLSIAIAEKVVNVSLKSSGEVIERMILAAIERSKQQAWAKIYISGHDAALMHQGERGILQAMRPICTNVRIEVMDNAAPGDCIIEFPDQIIDAGVSTQLDNIKEILQADDDD